MDSLSYFLTFSSINISYSSKTIDSEPSHDDPGYPTHHSFNPTSNPERCVSLQSVYFTNLQVKKQTREGKAACPGLQGWQGVQGMVSLTQSCLECCPYCSSPATADDSLVLLNPVAQLPGLYLLPGLEALCLNQCSVGAVCDERLSLWVWDDPKTAGMMGALAAMS